MKSTLLSNLGRFPPAPTSPGDRFEPADPSPLDIAQVVRPHTPKVFNTRHPFFKRPEGIYSSRLLAELRPNVVKGGENHVPGVGEVSKFGSRPWIAIIPGARFGHWKVAVDDTGGD